MIRSPGADREQSGPVTCCGHTDRKRHFEYCTCSASGVITITDMYFRPCRTLTVGKIMSLSNKCTYSKLNYLFVLLLTISHSGNQNLHLRINPGNFGKISYFNLTIAIKQMCIQLSVYIWVWIPLDMCLLWVNWFLNLFIGFVFVSIMIPQGFAIPEKL